MLTATDLTGEETQEKKNPKFLLLILALFIMAGVGYTAFLWVFEREKIVPKVPEQTVVDASAQAWYDEQKKLMESRMNIQSAEDSTGLNIVPIATDSSATTEPTVAPVIEKPVVVVEKPSVVSKPRLVVPTQKNRIEQPSHVITTENRTITPPKTSAKKVEAFFIPRKTIPKQNEAIENIDAKETNNNIPNNTPITNEELERFMRLFPDKKTYIQFIGYTKPTAEMDAAKLFIVQFLRKNGYVEVNDQWNFWYDHTAIKEVHYGQSGSNGANFYIPSFR